MTQKVAHIIYSGVGGTTDYLIQLVKGDEEKKIEHHVILFGIETPSEGHLNEFKRIAKVTVIQKKQGFDKSALEELKNYLVQNELVNITCHVNSLVAFKKHWCPVSAVLVFVEHQANHLKSRKEWIYSYLAQRRADWIVCLSKEHQIALKKKLKFTFKPQKNLIITTGVKLHKMIDPSKPCENFLMASRINDFRDHESLIKAFNEMKDATLHIAGDGPLLNNLKTKYKSDKVVFHGSLGPEALHELFAKMNCYVQASYGETSSMAIMQAQAYGLPIIATNVNGINNILNSENAILVEVQNIEQYQIAVNTIISDRELREKLALASYQYAESHLDPKKMFNAYLSLFK